MTSSEKPLNIVIVGGSLTGLFTGITLKSLPHVESITILERLREGQLQDLGAGIRCNEEVNDAVDEFIGVKPDAYCAFLKAFRWYDSEGNFLSKVNTGTWTTTWGQLYRTFRKGFDGDGTDPKTKYRQGCSFTGLERSDEDNTDTNKSQPRIRVDFNNEQGQQESIIADLVIGADGASSKVRSLVHPEIERTIAPYLCYRGVVDPSDLTPDTLALYKRAGLFAWPGRNTGYFVSYIVPGTTETPSEPTHCVNWVLYSNKTPEEMKQILVDKDGKHRQYSVPRGKMSDTEVQKLLQEARDTLPAPHVEVIERTKHPFVVLVTDSLTTRNSFWNGTLLLVGDAVGGQRPHAASALLQGVYHALQTRQLISGSISIDQWSSNTRKLTQILVEAGQEMAQLLMQMRAGPDVKGPLYVKVFMKAQEELNGIWRETVGLGDATVKM